MSLLTFDEVVDPDELIDADELVDAEVDAYLPEERGAGAIAVPLDSELPPVVDRFRLIRNTASSGLDPALSDTPGRRDRCRRETLQEKNRASPTASPYDILNTYPDGEYWIVDDTTRRRAAAALKDTLNEFRIEADVTRHTQRSGHYHVRDSSCTGRKAFQRIVGLQDNIALPPRGLERANRRAHSGQARGRHRSAETRSARS